MCVWVLQRERPCACISRPFFHTAAACLRSADLDDDEDINADYVPKNTSTRKLAAVAQLPRGAAAICVLTFGITMVGGLVLSALFSATASGVGGAVARNRAISGSDWAKTARVARSVDKQVDAVQHMQDELSLFNDMRSGGGGSDGRRRSDRRSRQGRGGGASYADQGDMPFLDPVAPMQQYDQYKQDYRRQERRRRARKSKSPGLTAAMQSYIDEAASFVHPAISKS